MHKARTGKVNEGLESRQPSWGVGQHFTNLALGIRPGGQGGEVGGGGGDGEETDKKAIPRWLGILEPTKTQSWGYLRTGDLSCWPQNALCSAHGSHTQCGG